MHQPAQSSLVAVRLGAAGRSRKGRRRAPRESVETVIGAVELESVAVGAFEVIADDLVLLDQLGVPLEPVGEPLVQLGARLLRERVVSGVADQEVPEAERVVVGERRLIRPDHVLAHEGQKVGWDVVAAHVRCQLLHNTSVEHLPLDGTTTDHVAFLRAEPVEAGLQERLDRRGHGDLSLRAALADHRDHLLEEERVSAGRGEDPGPRRPEGRRGRPPGCRGAPRTPPRAGARD